MIAEYNPERTKANRIMRDLPDGRGLGTFFWEPTQRGSWGSSLFTLLQNLRRLTPSPSLGLRALVAVGLLAKSGLSPLPFIPKSVYVF